MILILSLGAQQLAEPVAESNEDDEIQRQGDTTYNRQTEIATLFGWRRLNAGLHVLVEAADQQVIDHGRDDYPEGCPQQARKRQIDHGGASSSWCQSPVLQD